MFLSVAKIFRPLKSTELIYEVILINTEPRHVKSGADLHGKENVILVDFLFKGLFIDFSSNTSQMYMNGVLFFYHHGFSKQNIKFVTVKHFYTLTADVNDKKLVLWCIYYT